MKPANLSRSFGQSTMANDSAQAMRRPLPPAASPTASKARLGQMGRRNAPALRGLREHVTKRG